jgi:carbamoyltransferase
MRILGISTLGRGSAVALVDDHSVQFAVEEEKLNRLQDFPDVPRLALERCLKDMRLELSGLRSIALAIREAPAPGRKRPARTEAHQQLLQLLSDGRRVTHFDHHLCHAASAYYTSGMIQAIDPFMIYGPSFSSLQNVDSIVSINIVLWAIRFPDLRCLWVYSLWQSCPPWH